MKIKEIAFVAYAVTNVSKSRKFYEGVLGLKPNNESDTSKKSHWVEYNIGSGALGIGASEMWKPSKDGASVALEVANFDEALKTLKRKKIKFDAGPFEYTTCHMVVVRDPDGNKITLHKRKTAQEKKRK